MSYEYEFFYFDQIDQRVNKISKLSGGEKPRREQLSPEPKESVHSAVSTQPYKVPWSRFDGGKP